MAKAYCLAWDTDIDLDAVLGSDHTDEYASDTDSDGAELNPRKHRKTEGCVNAIPFFYSIPHVTCTLIKEKEHTVLKCLIIIYCLTIIVSIILHSCMVHIFYCFIKIHNRQMSLKERLFQ